MKQCRRCKRQLQGRRGKKGKTGYTGSSTTAYTGATGDTGYTGQDGPTGYTGPQINQYDSIYVNNLHELTNGNNILIHNPIIMSGMTGYTLMTTGGGIYAYDNINALQSIISDDNFLIYTNNGAMVFNNGSTADSDQRWKLSADSDDNLNLNYYDNNGETETNLLTLYRGDTGVYFHQGIYLPTAGTTRYLLKDHSYSQKSTIFTWGDLSTVQTVYSGKIGNMIIFNVPNLYFPVSATGSNSILSEGPIFEDTTLYPREPIRTNGYYMSDNESVIADIYLDEMGYLEINRDDGSAILSSEGLTAYPTFICYTN